ncbi:MAG: hypothetical protein RL757_1110 [Bacteroidota bacterium]|jgi:hypothetical protein
MGIQREKLHQKIGQILGGGLLEAEITQLALDVCRFQYQHNDLYQRFCDLLRKDVSKITQISEIPFLPIQFFKNYLIQTNENGEKWQPQSVFTSSGTTGSVTSQHLVRDHAHYLRVAKFGFERVYGNVSDYCVLALLPSYLEREGSSLIAMTQDFIEQSNDADSGFFLYDFEKLLKLLKQKQIEEKKVLLIGVSFALLDLAEKIVADSQKINLQNIVIMETGGMKGRRKEWTRPQLHAQLSSAFGVSDIHSEYGMTELLSQAYAPAQGLFEPMPTMKVVSRMMNDPLTILPNQGKLGVLNVVDLANLDTISFIATDDLCRIYENGTFEVLGRLDNSDLRGCNLMVAEG